MNKLWNSKVMKIPNTPWTLKGFSRAAFKTGFYIPELNIMFDGGIQNKNKPNHIFITHTHLDHIMDLPLTMLGSSKTNHIYNIYAPSESETWLKQFIFSAFNLSRCNNITAVVNKWFTFTPISPHKDYMINIKNSPYIMETFKCDHKVPTVSYGLKTLTQKLKPEYIGITGDRLKQLRKQGVVLTYTKYCNSLAYICDSTIKVFYTNANILLYKTIIVECTFLNKQDSNNSFHISWDELKPIVQKKPSTTFILMHFSLKYKDDYIRDFFEKEKEKNGIRNVELWL